MIEVLDQNTIDKIAAGEVVERPSAVVKELVENSIDAGANAVTIEIKDGGISMIRITDNGAGIAREEIPTAFLRHATSKIRSIEDLMTVTSLGFRGEALSSIAAVSQVELVTKEQSELCGCRYVIHGGEQKSIEEIGCPEGTTFIIRNLFYNTPARRKFLKSKSTEGNYIIDLVEHFALSHGEIAFKLICDGKIRIQTAGNNQCKNTIYYIYGSDITKAVLPVDVTENEMRLNGYIGKPEVSRGNRTFINYFINGRYIKSPIVTKAVEEAYSGYTMTQRYPFVTLFLTIDSSLIDVNVHPTKMEVRFSNGDAVYQLFYHTIKDALEQATLIPEVSISSVPKHQLFTAPIQRAEVQQPLPEPFEIKRKENNPNPPIVREEPKYSFEQLNLYKEELVKEEEKLQFRIIGQVFATYWLVEYRDELLIIDQHAAHEKVLYEKITEQLKEQKIYSQNLAVPIVVTLSTGEEEALQEHDQILRDFGFQFEHFGGKEYAIQAVPSEFYQLASKELFLEILDGLMEERQNVSDQLLDKCASMACKAAVKGNQILSLREAQELIGQMLKLENPYHCPHGRPTTIAMSQKEFEKKFKRIV